MEANEKRIVRAWRKCKSWITGFTASPTKTYLMNVPENSLAQNMQALAQQSENFRVSVISGQHQDESYYIGLEALPENLDLLIKDEIAELSMNFSAQLTEFVLGIRMIVFPLVSQLYALELEWWGDQVFPDDVDDYARFQILMRYFITLQGLFHAANLFVGPETAEMPGQETEAWVEI